MSQNNTSRPNSDLLCPVKSEQLLCVIDDVYGLPGTIDRHREDKNTLVSSVSAGKPWFGYNIPPDVLSRTRIVERWELDDEGVRTNFGVVKLVMQHIFPGEVVFTSSKSENGKMEITDVSAVDSWALVNAVIEFTPYDILGSIKRRELISMPVDKSRNLSDDEDSEIKFGFIRGRIEEEYRKSPSADYDIGKLTDDLANFVDQEHYLAAQRAA